MLALKIKVNKCLIFIFLSLLSINNYLTAQDKDIFLTFQSNPHESGYWWNENNNYGVSLEGLSLSGNINISTERVSYHVRFFGNNNLEKLYLNEAFIRIHLNEKSFIKIGKYYKDFSSYFNDELSSGHMIISNNAQTMPKIGFVSNFKLEKFMKLSFDYGISHGQFKKEGFYLDAPFLHEKFFYMNIALDKKRNLSMGLVHEAIWSGSTPELGKLPSSFSDFLKVVISADGPHLEGEPHPNALGSHIGIWDFMYEKNFDNHRSLKFYYQHYFEDTSSLRFANKTDGLWGFEIQNLNSSILLEYLNTTNAWLDPPYQRDYYYWNYQYKLGWSYEQKALGNPLVKAFKLGEFLHLGAKGEILNTNYQIKVLRKINENDKLKYKLSLGRQINDRLLFNIFTMNSDHSTYFGISFSTFFN